MENSKPVTYGAAVAIVGSPNVGKSTLLNRLLGKRVSIVSDKPQTTEHRILGVLTRENRQLLFFDTPGMGKPIGERAARINRVAEEVAAETDFVMWVLDARKGIGENDKKILTSLLKLDKPVIAVFNKMDLSNNEKIIPLVSELSTKVTLSAYVPVSAKTGDNLDKLMAVLFEHAPENPHLYDAATLTDQPDDFVIAEFIREQVFINSENEIPYGIQVVVESIEEDAAGAKTIAARIETDNARHRQILIGKGGAVVGKVRLYAKKRLKEYFGKSVALTLTIKARKGRLNPTP